MFRRLFIILFFFTINYHSYSQIGLRSDLSDISYESPKEYEIGGITVFGIKYLDADVLVHLSGLTVGSKIIVPGDEITEAVKKLWKQGLFSDVKIKATKIIGNKIFLTFHLKERPRLSKFSLNGAKKSEAEDIRDRIKLTRGKQITDNVINRTKNLIEDYYKEKGFLRTKVDIAQSNDTTLINHIILKINIDKQKKVKIKNIYFEGDFSYAKKKWWNIKSSENKEENLDLSIRKLKRSMKETKEKRWWRWFKSSKFLKSNLKEDKKNIIALYNENGYRDAKFLSDTVIDLNEKRVEIKLKIEKGKQYYFRNIKWIGNSKYNSYQLNRLLGIEKGDLFDQNVLDMRLNFAPDAVSNLYLDDGYLFFSVTPVEILVENDSIDLEMRIREGKQAYLNKISISGNTKTNEHVIRREIRTKPGELFSKTDIVRTIRELAQLGHFNPEKLNVNPIPDQATGTVDLEYTVEEKANDQVELSGGWGYGMFVGSLGVKFNNFAAGDIFKKNAWRPIPMGDGQSLGIRASANVYYQSYSISFVEPWFGGKKPTSLSVSLSHTTQRDYYSSGKMKIIGLNVGIGQRLKFPDDFFTLYNELRLQNYEMDDYTRFFFSNGTSRNFSFKTTFGRNSSGPSPIFPVGGSSFSLSLQLTPPYSLLNNKNYEGVSDNEKYEYLEYHKWMVKASWFMELYKNLVINTKASFGFISYYNKDIGHSPFEAFEVGGDGMSGYNFYGQDLIGMRGYSRGSLTPETGGNIYNKFTVEMRYPLSLNPSATFYVLTFLEAGNSWTYGRNFNPFNVKRSAGIGLRVFLPMMGLIGIDWGYGFDDPYHGENKGQWAFIIGQQIF